LGPGCAAPDSGSRARGRRSRGELGWRLFRGRDGRYLAWHRAPSRAHCALRPLRRDPWAQRANEVAGLLCADPGKWTQLKEPPAGANSPEWPIEQTRASEAAARAFWPLGNTGLAKRLPLIEAPTLLIWGAEDRILPRSYAQRFIAGIKGPTELKVIAGAGHLAELDKPDEAAAAILDWTR